MNQTCYLRNFFFVSFTTKLSSSSEKILMRRWRVRLLERIKVGPRKQVDSAHNTRESHESTSFSWWRMTNLIKWTRSIQTFLDMSTKPKLITVTPTTIPVFLEPTSGLAGWLRSPGMASEPIQAGRSRIREDSPLPQVLPSWVGGKGSADPFACKNAFRVYSWFFQFLP